MISFDDFFNRQLQSRSLFEAILAEMDQIGPAEVRVMKSQIVFRRKKDFAWVWIPGRYLPGKVAPLVLSLAFLYRHTSPRWKEVVEPYPGRFMHHLELFNIEDIDDEVRGWLKECWERS